MPASEEIIVDWPFGKRSSVRPCTHIRSTVITASIEALKRARHYDRYFELLAPGAAEEILAITPGDWTPMETAMRHYAACERLNLSHAAIVAMGNSVGAVMNTRPATVLARTVAEAGASPWTFLANVMRFWERVYRGSAIAVYKTGPKEARLEIDGCSLAALLYWRVGFQGIIEATLRPFCTKLYARQQVSRVEPTWCTYRLSWA